MGEFFDFDSHPGHLFVVATVLPLASFVILLLVAGVRSYLQRYQAAEGGLKNAYHLLRSRTFGIVSAYFAVAAIGLAFILCAIGSLQYMAEYHKAFPHAHGHAEHAETSENEHKPKSDAEKKAVKDQHEKQAQLQKDFPGRWQGYVSWLTLNLTSVPDPASASTLTLGYRIDHLAIAMFLMVTFIATLIHLFSIGYMSEELQEDVEDHEVHTEHGHLTRRGRFPRFFMFLSLFCFSMLNLILADNLFQVFVSWELVGICSFLLIGFYTERQSASNASNKAFITNRVGDAGMIIGLLILWTYVGTFNFEEIFVRVRTPEQVISHGEVEKLPRPSQIIRGEIVPGEKNAKHFKFDPTGDQVLLFPRKPHIHGEELEPKDDTGTYRLLTSHDDPVAIKTSPRPSGYAVMPYWLLVVAGLGIFLGCVGKSAQFPLSVWLPDAMEGPTPVSALIHAATMVAAGVYLVGRCFPLFTPEALLVIAYTGAITLFVAATIAIVMTDIKKVLAYSTVSQLGYMMLALGVGGWVAGLMHLLTHAFFKALLFLGSGSVIYGCHHVQEMGKMGGLYPKMKITALTMLIGVLAIAGTPFFSGWYSKDAILAQALGFGLIQPQHFLLFLLPLLTAGITTFYMFRMWLLTFTGAPKDEHVHEHAHESPWLMTVPLILLAFFSVTVAWGWPLWKAEESALHHHLHASQPKSVVADFERHPETGVQQETKTVNGLAHLYHDAAGFIALGVVLIAFAFALLVYYYRVFDPAEAKEQFAGIHRFLTHKWYFDELYSALLVRPALTVAHWCAWFDGKVIDGTLHTAAHVTMRASDLSGQTDRGVVDGLANLIGTVCWRTGAWLRNVQTGYLRNYVMFLAIAAIGIWIVLTLLAMPAPAAR